MDEIRTRKNMALLLLRTELDLTQQEFAEQIGISQGAYSLKELGRSVVTVPEAIRILEISGRKFEDIFLPADYKKLVVKKGKTTVRPVEYEDGGIYFEVDREDCNE